MKKLRTLIIDDERLARDEIKLHLQEYPFIEVVGEAADADEAEQLIIAAGPDLIFLDIHMPERSGLDLLESLDQAPEVIFTTAYDQYAVKAFELNALDYLVKPVRKERFQLAIEKIQARMNETTSQAERRHVFIREGERMFWIKIMDICLVESSGNYSMIYTTGRKYCLKRSLNQLEKILDPDVFFRAGRAAIINTNFIKEIKPLPKGKLEVSIGSGQTIEVSGRQSSVFKNKNMI
ncbi:response regulator transcription factor [Terrimonas sp. NA20]|uniref:Response regulator transcription factor n=1 Tax=Terrimonas ginsenosidimutans TaxID=2908004 RepID=A0ABS9KXK6_9BACT|nr:response regulator transcription factor [Terrimonas ginsenosidimutans]MCG2617074.1 response regulator transcription factor [Terrimonas ginsenosidimutans]